MATSITFPVLGSINVGVSTAFNSQLFSANTIYNRFTYTATSDGASQIYPRLDMISGLREWVGDRVVKSLSQTSFTIDNKTFEETIGIRREDIEDDRYGILTPAAEMLGQNAARFPDLLIARLMITGNAVSTYDGQNFFDAAHPNPNADGLTAGTVANYVAGSNAPWFLFDTTRVLRPFIYQTRRPFQVIPKFSMTDPQVFWNKEFEWGVDGRCNAGFGLWQLAYMSKAALTHDNVVAARAAMASIRRPDGAPMGIMPNLLVTGSANFPTAKALAVNDYQPGAATLLPNLLKGMFEPVENPWLN